MAQGSALIRTRVRKPGEGIERSPREAPFAELRSLFDVHLVEVVSDERGADDDDEHRVKHNAFGTRYGVGGTEGAQRVAAKRKEVEVTRA